MTVKMKLAALLLTFSFLSANTFAQCTPDNTFTEFGAYSSLGKKQNSRCMDR